MATRAGLIRLDQIVPNMDGVNKKVPKILPWHAWVDWATDDMPDGYRDGFTGDTEQLKEYWGIPVRDDKQRLVYDPNARTALEVTWTPWRFDETGAFESKVTLNVVSYKIWSPEHSAWGYKISAFKALQRVAMLLSIAYYRALVKTPPGDLQQALLRHFDFTGDYPLVHPDGAYAAPYDDILELELRHLEDDVIEDLNAASDSQTVILGPVAAPPADTTLADGASDGNKVGDGGDVEPILIVDASQPPPPDQPKPVFIVDPPDSGDGSATAPAAEERVTVQFPKIRK
jgi:hypothetical protein